VAANTTLYVIVADGELETARLFGKRVSETAARLK